MTTFSEGMITSSNYANKNLPDKWDILDKLYTSNLTYTGIDRIPKVIHQIWLGSQPSESLLKLSDTVKKANPGYEYKLWTDDDAEVFQFENKKLFNLAKNLGQKSDILRYAILKKYGGIYLDTDFIGLKSFDKLLHLDFFTGVSYDKEPTLFNGLIGCVPNNPLMDEINKIAELRDNDGMDVIKSTGPWFMTGKLFKNLNKAGKLVVLPVSYFYAYPNFSHDRIMGEVYTNYISDDSICVHLWESKWN
jgi:mannosyltransferase OCH1-like enzyme